MKRENQKQLVEDVLQAMDKIERYTKGLAYEKFVGNKILVDEVAINLETIGEKVKDIPEEAKEKYPDIPWKKMIELTNTSNLGAIWDIITRTLPETKPKIVTMLESFNEEV